MVVFHFLEPADPARKVVVSLVPHCKGATRGFSGNFGAETRATYRQFLLSFNIQLVILALDVVAENFGTLPERFEKGTDGVVPGKLIRRNKRGLDPFFVNLLAITMFGKIAFRGGKPFHESRFNAFRAEILRQSYCAARILNDLHRL